MPDDLEWFFENYRSTIVNWSTKPDQGWGESDWHWLDAVSYHPLETIGGELPWAVELVLDNLVQNLEDENWQQAAELMGAISHYTQDATMPLHATYNYNPGGNHTNFEREADFHLGELSIPDNYTPQELDDVGEAALATLEESFSFTREGSNGGVNLTDFLENNILWNDWIKGMTENRVRASVQFTANIWYTAMVRARLVATLTPHSPIYIDGNAGFTAANGVTSGSGTESDPYIIENWCISASDANGIEIRNTSAYFTIRNCLVENGGSSYCGVYLENVTNGEVKNATIENNRKGIYFAHSEKNYVRRCKILNSYDAGIALENSSNNFIYHNNFITNLQQAYDNGINFWDDGYPSGGNYWSDYNGTDNFWGENQDVSGSDGIGDTPYDITGNADQDHYPLMSPWTPSWTPTEPITPPPQVRVGVKAGDWIKLDFTISFAPPEMTLPEWMKVEFLSVDGTKVTVHVTMQMLDGTENSGNITVDVAAGGGIFRGPPGVFWGLSGFVIPSNSKTGDPIKIGRYDNVTIAGENSRTYARVNRTVVYANFMQRDTKFTYYWDKQTGVLVELSAVAGYMAGTAKVAETNMWQAGSSTGWPLIIGIIIVAMVIGIIVIFYARRMHPKKV
jgi:parallel beta-helix repeat protein